MVPIRPTTSRREPTSRLPNPLASTYLGPRRGGRRYAGHAAKHSGLVRDQLSSVAELFISVEPRIGKSVVCLYELTARLVAERTQKHHRPSRTPRMPLPPRLDAEMAFFPSAPLLPPQSTEGFDALFPAPPHPSDPSPPLPPSKSLDAAELPRTWLDFLSAPDPHASASFFGDADLSPSTSTSALTSSSLEESIRPPKRPMTDVSSSLFAAGRRGC